MESHVDSQAQYWASHSVFDQETRTEITDLIAKGDKKELEERFYKNLEFGTGGLRGVVAAGSYRMNRYNVRRATWAFATYLASLNSDKPIAVAVSYDSRLFSREFAEEAACVLAGMGHRCLITRDLRPVPMLSFMVRHFDCSGGICITASHNPPEYNGFKAYLPTGGQLVPPHDKRIIKLYDELDHLEDIPLLAFDQGRRQGLIDEVGSTLDEAYFDRVLGLSDAKVVSRDLGIVYTPIHGSGSYPVKECLRRLGYQNLFVVAEQEQPDGRFPTVTSPNPESPEALEMAVALARQQNADLVLGTDPDCDRVGVAVRDRGEFVFLNGNQVGSLLANYILSKKAANKTMPPSPLLVKTIVTTDLQARIAEFYNVDWCETLTGFKWIGALIEQFESGTKIPYRQYVFGGEESYGYLIDHFVRDKDGVTSCVLITEMAQYYHNRGQTLVDALNDLYRQFGCYQEGLRTVTLKGKDGASRIDQIMDHLRKQPPLELLGIKVTTIRDFLTSQEYDASPSGFDNSRSLSLPTSNVLQLVLADGSKVSVRPSGTEPKIKYYVSVRQGVPENTDEQGLQRVKAQCSRQADQLADYFVALAEA